MPEKKSNRSASTSASRPPIARTRSMRSGVAWNWCVTSRPAITSGTPDPNTIVGRLGVGPDVELGRRRCGCRTCHRPSSRSRRSRPARSGAACSARAMLVCGPTGTSQIPSVARQVSTMKATASVPSRGVVGVGRSAPSSPDSPWTNGAKWVGSTSGRSLPGVDRHVDPEQVAHHERVPGGPLERRIPGDGGDADQVGEAGGGDDRHGVVVARIAVEDDRWPGAGHACARHDGEHATPTCTLSGCARCPSRDWRCVPSRRSWCCRPARAVGSDDSADDAAGSIPVTDAPDVTAAAAPTAPITAATHRTPR